MFVVPHDDEWWAKISSCENHEEGQQETGARFLQLQLKCEQT